MFRISPKTILIAFLAFCVLSSKNIIIYNEETLVTLSFVLFVLFVFHYFGNTIKDSLDERSESIKKECQNFLQYKLQSLFELSTEHKKVGELQTALSQLMRFTKSAMVDLAETGGNSLESVFSQQMMSKCNELRANQLPQNLQSVLAQNQQQLVLLKCASVKASGANENTPGKENANALSAPVLKNAIQLLISTAKNK